MEDLIENLEWGKFQKRLVFIISLMTLCDGMEVVLPAIIGQILSCDWDIKLSELTIISTITFCGISIGCLFLGKLSDIYGRRKIALISVCFCTFFGLLSGVAISFSFFVIIRFIYGFFLSHFFIVTNLAMEFMPTSKRSFGQFYLGMGWSTGVLIVSLLPLTPMIIHWRILIIIMNIPLIAVLLSKKILPESLRYLIQTQKYDEAFLTLNKARKLNGKDTIERNSILLSNENVLQSCGSYSLLWNKEHFRTTLALSIGISFCTAAYFGSIFLQSTMLQFESHSHTIGENCKLNCYLLNTDYRSIILSSVSEFFGLIVSPFIWDRLGRRKSMIIESISGAVLIVIYLILPKSSIFLAFCFFYLRASLISATECYLLYAAEVYPTKIRGVGLGLAGFFNKFGSILGPLIGQGLYYIYPQAAFVAIAIILLISGISSMTLTIETANRPFETNENIEISENVNPSHDQNQ